MHFYPDVDTKWHNERDPNPPVPLELNETENQNNLYKFLFPQNELISLDMTYDFSEHNSDIA